jgi:hypothetical protein
MYHIKPNLYIGFHGCDEMIRNRLIMNPNHVEKSNRPYDWLGNGFYVWENNFSRALQWAKDKASKNEITKASVLGVVYTLSNCLDFTDSAFIDSISTYYYLMKNELEKVNIKLPKNRNHRKDKHNDKLIRELDCAVIEYCHAKIDQEIKFQMTSKGFSYLQAYDSVRGLFTEGGEAFPGAAIQKKNHIQVCIRNVDMIKGFFIPKVQYS